MKVYPLFASGDPVLFVTLGAVLLLTCTAIGLGCAGVLRLFGKSETRKKTGKRLLALAAISVVAAIVWWVSFTGFD
jgi:uncharacterized membrane protein HdeD (DUF308 family)